MQWMTFLSAHIILIDWSKSIKEKKINNEKLKYFWRHRGVKIFFIFRKLLHIPEILAVEILPRLKIGKLLGLVAGPAEDGMSIEKLK